MDLLDRLTEERKQEIVAWIAKCAAPRRGPPKGGKNELKKGGLWAKMGNSRIDDFLKKILTILTNFPFQIFLKWVFFKEISVYCEFRSRNFNKLITFFYEIPLNSEFDTKIREFWYWNSRSFDIGKKTIILCETVKIRKNSRILQLVNWKRELPITGFES